MNKKLLILATLLLSSMFVFAQDIIVTKDSKRIDAKVLEVNINDIKYKDWTNQDGPTYTLLKSDIASIIYQNGKVETFSNAPVQPTPSGKHTGNAPQGMSLSMFESMNDREQDEYFEKYVGGNIYKTFHSGVKLKRTAIGLLIPGLVLSTAGLVCTIVGAVNDSYYYYDGYYNDYYYYDEGALIAGLVLFPIGQALVIASIPVGAVGGGKKKHAQNEFRNTYFKDTSMKTSLDFGITQHGGVGFMLKF